MEFIVWLFLPQLLVYGFLTWLFRIPERGVVPPVIRLISMRLHGQYRRFRPGVQWEPGEHEVFRGQLPRLTARSIDRHVLIQHRSTCVVTNRRVTAWDARGGAIQLRSADLRTVRPQRTYDPADGFTYAVVVERADTTTHDPEGDLRLICSGSEQSRDLAAALEDLQSSQSP
jgi:hypothetical protein